MPTTEIQVLSRQDKIWMVLVFLFCLSLFVSKSLLTALAPILIFWSFFDPNQRQVWRNNKKVIALMSLFPLALICNIFSAESQSGLIRLTISWHWPLLAAAGLCAIKDARSYKYAYWGFGLGLILSISKTLGLLFLALQSGDLGPFMDDHFRIGSFWDVSRWGYFSGLALLTIFLFLHENVSGKYKQFLFILLVLTLFTFIISNSRAPLLGIIAVLSLLSITSFKLFRNTIILLLASFTFLLSNPQSLERIKSIFSISVNSEKVTSSHKSNAGRLHMWKVALDFFKQQPYFGTGFESSAKPLKSFLEGQDKTYLENYTTTEFSYNDQHSSYLNTLIQMGLFYFIICWGFIIFLVIRGIISYFRHPDPFTRYLIAGLLYCLIVFVFYSSFNSYEVIPFIFFLTALGEPLTIKKSIAS